MLKRMLTALVRRRRLAPIQSFPLGGSSRLAEVREMIAAGDLKLAEDRLREIIRKNGSDAESYRLLGSAVGADGRPEEAREILEYALTLEPEDATGWVLLGNAHRFSGHHDAAERHYRRALELDPASPIARFGVACVNEHFGRIDAAREVYRALLEPPAFVPALQALIRLLLRLGEDAEAKATCVGVLSREPDQGAAHAAMGFVLLNRELNAEAALAHFECALQAGYGDDEVLKNRDIARGISLQHIGRLQEAIESYDAALRARPNDPLARFHRALALLQLGDFERGWPDYETRLASEDKAQPPSDLPRWGGEGLSEKTLLVYGEQGIGDEIMFASCLPELIRMCPNVVLMCAPKLRGIFARSFPQIDVVSSDTGHEASAVVELQRASVMTAIGSLPLYLRQTRDHFPRHEGYLLADAGLVAQYRQRLDALGPALKVGFSWRGGTVRSRHSMRSLEAKHVSEILAVPGVQFVNLQYDSSGEEQEIADAVSSGRLIHWSQALADYEHTAALVSCVDVVVSVCTAVIHLAGALGRPVWVMTPFSPEWRYGLSGAGMPWYPSVELIRQSAHGDWAPVVGTVCSRLQALAADVNFHRNRERG